MSCMTHGWMFWWSIVLLSFYWYSYYCSLTIGDKFYKWKGTSFILFSTFKQELFAWISEAEERLHDIWNDIDGVALDARAMKTSSGGNQYCVVRFAIVKTDTICHVFWDVARDIQIITNAFFKILTYWPFTKMVAILQTTFSMASWKW